MTRSRTLFVCSTCDAQEPKWAGQCSTCGTWNSMSEQEMPSPTGTHGARPRALSPGSLSPGSPAPGSMSPGSLATAGLASGSRAPTRGSSSEGASHDGASAARSRHPAGTRTLRAVDDASMPESSRSDPSLPGSPKSVSTSNIIPIDQVQSMPARVHSTGIPELDRVLGGGLVPGSVTLLGGEPGVGKSTLVLQLLGAMANGSTTCLYVTGEESAQQVRMRSDRLGLTDSGLLVTAEVSVPAIVDAIDQVRPSVCVIDSVQTLDDPEVASSAGSVAQVRSSVNRIVAEAKARCVTTVLVGHVTKDGSLAGPRLLEHAVDTVLWLEGDRDQGLRVLRSTKHRFGSTSEIGLMTLGQGGLSAVEDVSGLFLADRLPRTPGSVVSATVQGNRALAIEVQALVVPSVHPQPKRSAKGLDAGRLGLLLAVMEQHCGLGFAKHDVFANIAGGVKVGEPGVDLAVCVAIASAAICRPVPEGWFLVGEVGLGGEIRGVTRVEQRLVEASRLGFDSAMVPRSGPSRHSGLEVVRVSSLYEALSEFWLDDQVSGGGD